MKLIIRSGAIFLCMLALSRPAQAQDQPATPTSDIDVKVGRSHDLSNLAIPEGDPEVLLRRRLTARQVADELAQRNFKISPQIIQQFLSRNPEIEKIAKDLKPGDPNFQEKIKEAVRDLAKQQKLDTTGLTEALGKGDQMLRPKTGEPKRGFAEIEKTSGPTKISPRPVGVSTGQSGRMEKSTPDNEKKTGEPPSEGAPKTATGGSRWMRSVQDFASKVMARNPELQQSAAVQKFAERIIPYVNETDPRWAKLDSAAAAVEGRWGEWSQRLPLDRLLPKKDFHWPQINTPSWLSRMQSREPRLPSAPSMSGVPNLDAPSPAGLTGFFGVLLIGGLGFFLLRMLGQSRLYGARAKPAWQLGPWPVNPATVSSREELVRAFEYLSLLRLGPAARAWNHQAIAEKLDAVTTTPLPMTKRNPSREISAPLAQAVQERRRAVHELSQIYEKARYTPLDEALPESSVANARRDLSLLAGFATP